MKSVSYLIFSCLLVVGVGSGCDEEESQQGPEATAAELAAFGQPQGHAQPAPAAGQAAAGAAGAVRGTVAETMNAAGYTYVRLDSANGSVWAAVTETQVAVGDEVELAGGAPMRGFHSKTLNRTFEQILFANGLRVLGGDGDAPAAAPGSVALPPGHPPVEPGSAPTPAPEPPAAH